MAQWEAFQQIVAALNEAALDDARWPEASKLIDEAFGAKGNTLVFAGDLPANSLEIYFAKSHQRGENRSRWTQEYFRVYHAVDEHVPRVRKLPDCKIVPRASLFSERELMTSLAYNEGYARYEMQNGLSTRLDGPDGSRIVWSIWDPVNPDGWSTSRIEMVARVLPHVRQYVRVRSALAEANALGASFAELLDNTRIGIIQLDQSGEIVETNDSAQTVLRCDDGISDAGGELRVVRPEDQFRFETLLGRALPPLGDKAESGSMLVRRRSLSPRYALHVMPILSRKANVHSKPPAALVLIVDPARRVQVEPALVATALELSPAEAEIAVMIAKGLTLRQIAAKTGRAYSTVRTHVKNTFAKLGASRQIEVAQAVLALSDLPRQ